MIWLCTIKIVSVIVHITKIEIKLRKAASVQKLKEADITQKTAM